MIDDDRKKQNGLFSFQSDEKVILILCGEQYWCVWLNEAGIEASGCARKLCLRLRLKPKVYTEEVYLLKSVSSVETSYEWMNVHQILFDF